MFLEFYKNKILTPESAMKMVAYYKLKDKKIVFTNGCFDVLHVGHLHILSAARELGQALIVGLNSDKSVRNLKGMSRPVQHEDDRALLLAGLSVVDAIVLFDELTPLQLIEQLQPDVLVKGGDYKIEEIVGNNIVKQIEVIPFIEGYSSSLIIKKIKSL